MIKTLREKNLNNKEFLTNRFLPIFSLLFFIAAKFFFNFLLWRGRVVPPEPGDVFNYFRWIRAVSISYLSLTPVYTAYAFVLGNLSKIFHISPENLFYWSFWAGFVMLAAILWRFFKDSDFPPAASSICFLLLAFYTGHGSFHGFYWVVPSFFSFVAFLYLAGAVLADKKINWRILGIIAFIYPLIHGTGVFSLVVFLMYPFFYFTLLALPKFSFKEFAKNMDIEIIKKCGTVFLIEIFSYVLFAVVLHYTNADLPTNNSIAYSEDIVSLSQQVGGLISGQESSGSAISPFWKETTRRYSDFNFGYLNKVLPHPLFLLFWIFIFWILFFYEKYKILSLFFSVFIFSFASSMLHYKGTRSLLYLWPITYILLGYSFYCIYLFIGELNFTAIKKKILKIAFVLLVVGFLLLNLFYSFWYIDIKNRDMNIFYNSNIFDGIISNYDSKDTGIYFDNYFPLNAFFYKHYEKGYKDNMLQWTSYEDDLNKNRKVIIVLENDEIFKQSKSDDIWKRGLQLMSSAIGITTSDYATSNSKSAGLSIDDKLALFNLPVDKDHHKVIYSDKNYYIFELISK